MSLLKVITPTKSWNSFTDKHHPIIEEGSPTQQAYRKADQLPKITVTQGCQNNVLKCLEGVEEHLEDLTFIEDVDELQSTKNRQYWESIKQQLMEIAELTCQTCQFEQCCSGEVGAEGCPFYNHMRTSPPAVKTPLQRGSVPPTHCGPLHLRRGSAPPTYCVPPLHPRRYVSYGGFESIMSSYYDSDFEIEERSDDIWTDASKENFRRDRGVPVRKKKSSNSLPQLCPVNNLSYVRKRTNTSFSLTD